VCLTVRSSGHVVLSNEITAHCQVKPESKAQESLVAVRFITIALKIQEGLECSNITDNIAIALPLDSCFAQARLSQDAIRVERCEFKAIESYDLLMVSYLDRYRFEDVIPCQPLAFSP
jgi:hypothetical protein